MKGGLGGEVRWDYAQRGQTYAGVRVKLDGLEVGRRTAIVLFEDALDFLHGGQALVCGG
jgi:hypothetical protein